MPFMVSSISTASLVVLILVTNPRILPMNFKMDALCLYVILGGVISLGMSCCGSSSIVVRSPFVFIN